MQQSKTITAAFRELTLAHPHDDLAAPNLYDAIAPRRSPAAARAIDIVAFDRQRSPAPTRLLAAKRPVIYARGVNDEAMRRSRMLAMLGASMVGGVAACTRRTAEPVDVRSFAQARAHIEESVAAEEADDAISSAGRTRLYHHGRATARSVLLLHGFTNCPQQFDELARALYRRGCNVYVPRIPGHGEKDRLTQDLGDLSVETLQRFSTDAYHLASRLGERTSVIGLSLGGTLALWLAQTQPVDRVVPVAPFLQPAGWTRNFGRGAMRVAQVLPDVYCWWDVRILTNTRPLYAYPGYPIHALAQVTFLGDAIFDLAATAKPLATHCTLVSNVDDNGINNAVSRDLLVRWQQHGAPYDEVTFRNLGVPRHDIIDPTTFPNARSLVYPKLESLALGRALPAIS